MTDIPFSPRKARLVPAFPRFSSRPAAERSITHPVASSEDAPLVRVENLSVAFRQRREWKGVVSGVSFTLSPGRCVALVGESGSGKSVTARCLLGLNGPSARVEADTLSILGQDVRGLGEAGWRRLRGRRIGYVLQDALTSLDPLRTVGSELVTAIRAAGPARPESDRERAIELLRRAAMPEPEARFEEYPAQLSGGLRQRALVATALAGEPKLLIADEPTTALDASVQKQILSLFASLKESGLALILISHDLRVVADLADDVVILRAGEMLEYGPTLKVLGAPAHPYTQELVAAIPRLMSPPARAHAPEGGAAEQIEEIVTARGIVKHFRPRRAGVPARVALSGVSLSLHRGRTLGLVGESGSGKSTFGRILAGLEQASGGEVVLSPSLRAARGKARPIQFVYQDPLSSFDPRHTAGRIVEQAIGMRFGRETARQRRARALEWLDRVGLSPSLHGRRPLTLSGGQRQRIAIARALAVEPELVILDEPVSALDVLVQRQILDLIVRLQRETEVSFLFISHDLGVIHAVSHEVAVLKDGALREYGSASDVFASPADSYTRQLIEAIPQARFL